MEQEKLRPFKYHGTVFHGVNGEQAYGDCPLCGKEHKFYVNHTNGLWDCKSCESKGNITNFLEYVGDLNQKHMRRKSLERLSKDRGLPVEVFKEWEVGRNGTKYTIPIRNTQGRVHDIRTYKPGSRVMSTAGCKVGLMGLYQMTQTSTDIPVYLCEGEWDGMAMSWLLKQLRQNGVVVAVPGAGTFKKEWIDHFKDRTVYVMYDNDGAGEKGEYAVSQKLQGVARKVVYLHWLSSFPDGYDVRDHIVKTAVQEFKPKKAFKELHQMFESYPRTHSGEEVTQIQSGGEASSKPKFKETSLKQVYAAFDRKLYLPNYMSIDMVGSVVMANLLQGNRLWSHLVASPGGGKTEIIVAFEWYEDVFTISSFTSNTLISGMAKQKGKETSLLPEWDGKIVMIKDFTPMNSQKDMDKDNIFGQLRDFYDGSGTRAFGTGEVKSFKSSFNMVTGVTPSIYETAAQQNNLGARFLIFHMGGSLDHEFERKKMRIAMRNTSQVKELDENIKRMVHDYIWTIRSRWEWSGKAPSISWEMEDRIIAQAEFTARTRGTIARGSGYNETVIAKPFREVGTRLATQFQQTVSGSAMWNGRDVVTAKDLVLVRKLSLDSISQRTEDIIRTLYLHCPSIDDTFSTSELTHHTHYPESTLRRLMEDMMLLGLVDRSGGAHNHHWQLTPLIRNLIKEAGFYETKEEIERPLKTFFVKTKKRKLKIRKKRKNT